MLMLILACRVADLRYDTRSMGWQHPFCRHCSKLASTLTPVATMCCLAHAREPAVHTPTKIQEATATNRYLDMRTYATGTGSTETKEI